MSELRAAKVVSDFSRATREKERQGTLLREAVSVNFHTDSACNVAPTKVADYFRAPTLGACSLCKRLSTYPRETRAGTASYLLLTESLSH